MKAADLESVQNITTTPAANTAAKWWADHLRELKTNTPEIVTARDVKTTRDLIQANRLMDGAKLTPDLIDQYEHELAMRIQSMMDSGTESMYGIGIMLQCDFGPGIAHEYALKAAGIQPSLTILPASTGMMVNPRSRPTTVVVTTPDGTLQIYPPLSELPSKTTPVKAVEDTIRAAAANPPALALPHQKDR